MLPVTDVTGTARAVVVLGVFCLNASAAGAADTAVRFGPVVTVGGGYGALAERGFCESPCGPTAEVEGPAGLIAGGWEAGTAMDMVAVRAEVELMPVVGRGGWALGGGPVLTLRLLALEVGSGMMVAHIRGADDTATSAGGLVRFWVGAPMFPRWTIHGGLDYVFGSDSGGLGAVLLGLAGSRRF
jgi:hypothetical protein